MGAVTGLEPVIETRWAVLWIVLAAIGGMWVGAYLALTWWAWAIERLGRLMGARRD